MAKDALTHIDEKGNARMVDVTAKSPTSREAVARGKVRMQPQTLALIEDHKIPKGDVYSVARVAGIMAAKKTSDIIPMCHPLEITGIDISFTSDLIRGEIEIEVRVSTWGRTGVEMEALTAVGAAALTIYDMCKAVDRAMTLTDIRLISKRGGKSGDFVRET
jgi:cyclic pyranopterin phosphate synthase